MYGRKDEGTAVLQIYNGLIRNGYSNESVFDGLQWLPFTIQYELDNVKLLLWTNFENN